MEALAAIVKHKEKKKQNLAKEKQEVTNTSNFSRYYNNFDKNLCVRVWMISLRSLKSTYIQHSFTVSRRTIHSP